MLLLAAGATCLVIAAIGAGAGSPGVFDFGAAATTAAPTAEVTAAILAEPRPADGYSNGKDDLVTTSLARVAAYRAVAQTGEVWIARTTANAVCVFQVITSARPLRSSMSCTWTASDGTTLAPMYTATDRLVTLSGVLPAGSDGALVLLQNGGRVHALVRDGVYVAGFGGRQLDAGARPTLLVTTSRGTPTHCIALRSAAFAPGASVTMGDAVGPRDARCSAITRG